jgi:hypothetical protein
MLRKAAVDSLIALVALFSYLMLGAVVYMHVEGWTLLESTYFCIVTMTTVGYGDYSPETPLGKAFTLVMILVGIIFVFSKIAKLVGLFTSPLTGYGRYLLEWAFPQDTVDIDGNGEVDYKVPRHWTLYYSKNLLPSCILTLGFQIVSAAVFVAVEPSWSFGDAFYHCIVTASTVGYGDMTLLAMSAKVWAIFHILFSVAMLGEIITTVDQLREERAAQLAKVAQLRRRLDEQLLQHLSRQVVKLRPQAQPGEKDGLTELEFVLCMLLELGIVDWSQVRPFIKQFRKLDVDANGRLDDLDYKLVANIRSEELEKAMELARKCNGTLLGAMVGPTFAKGLSGESDIKVAMKETLSV